MHKAFIIGLIFNVPLQTGSSKVVKQKCFFKILFVSDLGFEAQTEDNRCESLRKTWRHCWK